MADESNAGPVAAAVAADAEVKAPTAKKRRSPRPQKAASEPAQSKPPAAKRRGYSEQEESEKLRLIETQVSEANTLKDAIKSAGISEQTYYHWKGAAKPVPQWLTLTEAVKACNVTALRIRRLIMAGVPAEQVVPGAPHQIKKPLTLRTRCWRDVT
ncbi:hypothetical protein PZN02_005901 (plasmid) [Sinorhizobium garamanticum]|uniref:Transposase n=1 Tax=Sinorhizobium garamanticum TaxID=680247 RepID=A0ABY8DMR9_9HYPH|nr:hypothetical protein [Sinorhizobium garamanticum]WEX91627.1 hypothetical protein PZN02_005901 [Sinorhizobium garamanticum]